MNTHPQFIQDVDEFVSSSEQIWRNLALYHLLTNGSSAVNGCRQNECFLQINSFSLHKMLIDGLESGLLLDYCDVFISCLYSHSDGTHSLQSIHWRASDVMLNFSKSDEETNSSTSWMDWGWGHFQLIIISLTALFFIQCMSSSSNCCMR